MQRSVMLGVCAFVAPLWTMGHSAMGEGPRSVPITIHNQAEDGAAGIDRTDGAGNSQGTTAACVPSGQPIAEMAFDQGQNLVVSTKNRVLSFTAGDPGRLQAIRITFVNLPPGFEPFIGQNLWVGQPFDVSELPGRADNTPPTFLAATLQCQPFYMDWSAVGTIHVFHEVIVPSKFVMAAGPIDVPALYDIQVIDSECAVGSEANYSIALEHTTSGWGDSVGMSFGSTTAPDGSVTVVDTLAMLNAYVGNAGPLKPWFLLDAETLDLKTSILEIMHTTNAFSGRSYPFSPPAGLCPTCGNGIREAGEQCDDGDTISGDGCDAVCQEEPGGGLVPFSIVPVASELPSLIVGNQITVDGGGFVELEITLGNWDPLVNGTLLQAFQAQIDSSGYASGLSGALEPALVACTDDTDCRVVMGGVCTITGGPCVDGTDCPLNPAEQCGGPRCLFPLGVGGFCEPGHMYTGRSDYVYIAAGGDFDAIDLASPDPRFGSAASSGGGLPASDATFPAYVGTLFLDIPVDAEGTFTVGFSPGTTETFLIDQNNNSIPYGVLEPVVIIVPPSVRPCCQPDFSCSLLSATDCSDAGGTVVSACLGDLDGDGSDDACLAVIPPGTDCWRTTCGSTKSSFCDHPIPADFFAPGSDPFSGSIQLGGGSTGDFDTSVQRYDPMLLENPGSADFTTIELVELDLVSCEPITIDINGGATTQQWNVTVKLSAAAPPQPGLMSVSKTHTNGGVFSADFSVNPVFTFSRVDEPSDIRILDTWQAGLPAIQLATQGDAPWVHRPTSGSTVFTCGVHFAPGVFEDPVTGEQCCRKVGHAGPKHFHETAPPDCSTCPANGACCLGNGSCQVASRSDTQTAQDVCESNLLGTYMGDLTDCADSDFDGIMNVFESNDCCGNKDVCHTGTDPTKADTDGDGCLDGEELANGTDPCDRCDYGAACMNLEPDCNGNGIPDECDVRAGTSKDCNGNHQPDECETGTCCGISGTTGTPACVETSKSECEALNPPGEFRGPCHRCPPQKSGTARHDGGLIIHTVGPPKKCPDEEENKAAAICLPSDPKIDRWVTTELDLQNPTMCHDFGAFKEAIPINYFGHESAAINFPICFEGLALGIAPFPDADTMVQSDRDPFNRCTLPSGPVTEIVDIVVTNLQLMSLTPITVNYGDGTPSDLWDVKVVLSDVPQETGTLTAQKTHCNGGIYSVTRLPVQPKFIFTKVSNSAEVIEFDRADFHQTSVDFTTQDLSSGEASQWVHDVDPFLGVAVDVCTDFHPVISDDNPVLSCNCNGNTRRDKCDIESGDSLDCDLNGIPDECQIPTSSGGMCLIGCDPDCDGNGVPDRCDPDCNNNDTPDACDIAAGTSQDCFLNGVPDECEPDCNTNGIPDTCDLRDLDSADCNGNSVPDECEPDCNRNNIADSCDLAGTAEDTNEDGIPDSCTCFDTFSAPELIADATGQLITSNKMRWISLSAGGTTGGKQAIRVTFVDMPVPFDVYNGIRMWVGPPIVVSANPGEGFFVPPTVPETFKAAELQCFPFYRDWSGDGIVHVFHKYIIPLGVYIAEVIDEGCAQTEAISYTSSVDFENPKWADPVGLVDGEWVAPDGTTNVFDTLAVLRAFRDMSDAPDKVRAEMHGIGIFGPEASIDAVIHVVDLVAVLNEFETGAGYPYLPDGDPCPGFD